MKTNIITIRTTEGTVYGSNVGGYIYIGRWTREVETCGAYNILGIGIVGITDDGEIVRDGSIDFYHPRSYFAKRGRHSHSNNKRAQRYARLKKQFGDDLPF